MALTSSCWGSSLHPGDSTEAQPCGLTSSEVWVVPVSQPPLNPAPGGARAWLWTCAPGVVDPTGCVLLLALISVSLTILALLAAGTQDLFHCWLCLGLLMHTEWMPGTAAVLKALWDWALGWWGCFCLEQHLLLHDEHVPACTQRYRNGAEMVHVNWRQTSWKFEPCPIM